MANEVVDLKALQAELNAALEEHGSAVVAKEDADRESNRASNRLSEAKKKLAAARAKHDEHLDKEMGVRR